MAEHDIYLANDPGMMSRVNVDPIDVLVTGRAEDEIATEVLQTWASVLSRPPNGGRYLVLKRGTGVFARIDPPDPSNLNITVES